MTASYIDGPDEQPSRHQGPQSYGLLAASDALRSHVDLRLSRTAHLPARLRRCVGRLITRM